MDGTVDYALWNDSTDNVNVSSECEEHEGTDCEEDTAHKEDGESNSDW
jgi:hypothetical protein